MVYGDYSVGEGEKGTKMAYRSESLPELRIEDVEGWPAD